MFITVEECVHNVVDIVRLYAWFVGSNVKNKPATLHTRLGRTTDRIEYVLYLFSLHQFREFSDTLLW